MRPHTRHPDPWRIQWRDTPEAVRQIQGAWGPDRKVSARPLFRRAREVAVRRPANHQAPGGPRSGARRRAAAPRPNIRRPLSHQPCSARLQVHRHGDILHLPKQGLQELGRCRRHPDPLPPCGRHPDRHRPDRQGTGQLLPRGGAGVPRAQPAPRPVQRHGGLHRALHLRQPRHQEVHPVSPHGRIQEDPSRRDEAPWRHQRPAAWRPRHGQVAAAQVRREGGAHRHLHLGQGLLRRRSDGLGPAGPVDARVLP